MSRAVIRARRAWVLALTWPVACTLVAVLLQGWFGIDSVALAMVLGFGPGYVALYRAHRHGPRRAWVSRMILLTLAYFLMGYLLLLLGVTASCALFGACL